MSEWFTGAQVSYVEHLFRGRDPERVALIDARESAQPGAGPVSRQLTWGMLREQVGGLAAMLRDLGVGPGDRVAGYVPNAAEAVIAFLATASLGAVWSGCGQDYSPAAAAERLGQLEPAVLIAADGYRYGGRVFDRRGSVSELAALLPTLRATIVFPRLGLPPTRRTRRPERSAGRARRVPPSWYRERCRSATRYGCCSPRAPPAGPRGSCTAPAGSCWNT